MDNKVPTDYFTKEQMSELVENAKTLWPILVPSYKRYDRKENKTLVNIIEPSEELRNNTYVFVRQNEYEQYKDAFPTLNIVKLPEVHGLASTRQTMFDFVENDLKADYYIDVDDDIKAISYVFYSEEHNKDRLVRSNPNLSTQIFKLACETALMAFEKYNCAIGNFHRFRFSSMWPNSQIAYKVNLGSTPRQVVMMNRRLLTEQGIRRDLRFDPTGDDVGLVAVIAAKKLNFFQFPSLAYEFVDDAINSVVRNDSNRRELAAYEYDTLKKFPMIDYLRIPHKYEDGSYKFSDIDYRKYTKLTGLQKAKVTWKDYIAWKRAQA